MNKQIEEMAKVIHENFSSLLSMTECKIIAAATYEAGFRKQSRYTLEVVRCKDCKHSRPMIFDGYYLCKRHHVVRKADDFCSRGERRCRQ
jgi:hypothetical protein